MQKILNFDNPRGCSVSLRASEILVLEEMFVGFVLPPTQLALEGQFLRFSRAFLSFWPSVDRSKAARAELAVVFELFPRSKGGSALFALSLMFVHVKSKGEAGGKLLRAHPALVKVKFPFFRGQIRREFRQLMFGISFHNGISIFRFVVDFLRKRDKIDWFFLWLNFDV